MGLLIDTDVLVLAERGKVGLDLGRYLDYGNAFISVLTASELLVGVHRALDEDVRSRRLAFVEGLLSALPVWPSTLKPLVFMRRWWRRCCAMKQSVPMMR